MEWPRIPLPGWPDGKEDEAATILAASAARGQELAAYAGFGHTCAWCHRRRIESSEIASIAVPSTADGGNMAGDDFALTVGWGHFGQGEAVMPGHGRVIERPYTSDERTALGNAARTLGDVTLDICLNDRAYWRNIPEAVWNYKLGGYQVLKKWLSYRERRGFGSKSEAGRGPALHRHCAADRGHLDTRGPTPPLTPPPFRGPARNLQRLSLIPPCPLKSTTSIVIPAPEPESIPSFYPVLN